MATVPNPRTWGSTEQVTAAKLNTDVRDGFEFLAGPPRAILGKNASQLVSSGIIVAVSWNTEILDTDGGHNNITNNTRYTAQTAGWYALSCCLTWSYGPTNLTADMNFRKNGNLSLCQGRGIVTTAQGSPGSVVANLTSHMHLAVGDYVDVIVTHLAGTSVPLAHNLATPARFNIEWVRS